MRSKILLLIIVIVAITAIYLLFRKPEDPLAVKQRCQEAGLPLYERDRKDVDGSDATLFEPEFGYSKELKTCLYAGGLLGTRDGITTIIKWVKDSYSNQELISYSEVNGEAFAGSRQEFERRKQELFRQ